MAFTLQNEIFDEYSITYVLMEIYLLGFYENASPNAPKYRQQPEITRMKICLPTSLLIMRLCLVMKWISSLAPKCQWTTGAKDEIRLGAPPGGPARPLLGN